MTGQQPSWLLAGECQACGGRQLDSLSMSQPTTLPTPLSTAASRELDSIAT